MPQFTFEHAISLLAIIAILSIFSVFVWISIDPKPRWKKVMAIIDPAERDKQK